MLMNRKCGDHLTVHISLQRASRDILSKYQTLADSFRIEVKRDPTLFHQIKGKIDVFKACKSSDDIHTSFSSNSITFYDLNINAPLLAPNHGELDPSLDSTCRKYSLPLEKSDISSFVSSSFSSKDDSTSCSFSAKIILDLSLFECHLLDDTSDLESVNSTDYE